MPAALLASPFEGICRAASHWHLRGTLEHVGVRTNAARVSVWHCVRAYVLQCDSEAVRSLFCGYLAMFIVSNVKGAEDARAGEWVGVLACFPSLLSVLSQYISARSIKHRHATRPNLARRDIVVLNPILSPSPACATVFPEPTSLRSAPRNALQGACLFCCCLMALCARCGFVSLVSCSYVPASPSLPYSPALAAHSARRRRSSAWMRSGASDTK